MTQNTSRGTCATHSASGTADGTFLETLRHVHGASGIADTVMRRAILCLEEGVTEELHAARIEGTLESLGAQPLGSAMVAFGANTADPQHVPDGTELHIGDTVTIRFGCHLDEAPAVIARTVFFGQVDEERRIAYGAVSQAFLESFSFAADGCRVGDIFAKIRDSLAENLPEAEVSLNASFDAGADSLIVLTEEDADAVLRVGMLVLVDVTASMADRFGIRMASLVLIEEDGCEVLSRYPIAMSVLDAETRRD